MDQVSISRIVDNHRGSGVVRWCLVASERYLAVGIAPSSAAAAAAAAAAALSSKNVLYMLVALPIHCVALLPVLKNVKGKKKNGMQSSKRIDKNDDMEKKSNAVNFNQLHQKLQCVTLILRLCCFRSTF